MAEVIIKDNQNELAKTAAAMTADSLNRAIAAHGSATWVLAGGSTPMAAYIVLVEHYLDQVDWSKITVVLGDERCVPLHHPDSNWQQIQQAFLDRVPIPPANQLRPPYELPAEQAAAGYEQTLACLPKNNQGIPRFDLIWLGVGEDGHTLSLFPGHPALADTSSLVVPVHDAPKPPSDRISLTLRALQNTTESLIMAAGSSKTGAITQAFAEKASLPVALAVQTLEAANGTMSWLTDQAAAPQESV